MAKGLSATHGESEHVLTASLANLILGLPADRDGDQAFRGGVIESR
jgi:hypothetical protein